MKGSLVCAAAIPPGAYSCHERSSDTDRVDRQRTAARLADAPRPGKPANKTVRLPAFHTGTLFGRERDAEGNLLPLPTVEQRERDGEKIYMLVGAALQSSDQVAWEMLVDIRKRGTQALDEWRMAQDQMAPEQRLPADLIPTHEGEFWETYLPPRRD